jgi:hypothetical protein
VTDAEEQWREVDELLFTGRPILAIKTARKFCGSLGAATDEVQERWKHLRATTPERFLVPLDGYWSGFYS